MEPRVEKSAGELGQEDRVSDFLSFGRDVLVDQLPELASPSDAPARECPFRVCSLDYCYARWPVS